MKRLLVLALLLWPSFAFAQGINNPCITTASTTVPGCVKYGTTAGTAAQGNDSRITSITSNGTAAVGQLPGTTTNDSASAGNIGEIITSTVLSASGISLTSGVVANITSISLTAGDWDVSGVLSLAYGPSTTKQVIGAGASTTSATLPSATSGALSYWSVNVGQVILYDDSVPFPVTRISLASTTTVYMTSQVVFAVSTAKGYGFIRARRVR